ncbi:acetyltransferase (GNAT) family protein [Salegentibacter sp. 24]|uniref:GNAT family N-acetyltransferase n=1 Tax=Salegentibacter sp. 24 TaxID=2183986 RepID=UPI00105C6639|nr:GNAT family N-acetyltransferase [Salegentibacter sp. 24]TDN82177.1 acetyltransferase (GNAT) family protein [Salegentibacter sp. 24]
MEIRVANENDIPDIVDVLKASLGEGQLELSEKVWRFKHIDNPFGKSIVFLAIEDNKIIGVRAFMRWKWQHGSKQFSALRAVDTATHPNHQGKGIFKKLTLKAVDYAKADHDNFIFNTPNEKSRPGYLKMGWRKVGKINIGLKPSLSFLNLTNKETVYKLNKNISQNQIEELCQNWNKNLATKTGLFTPKSAEILMWRYEKNPLQSYEIDAGAGYYLAIYIKKRGKFREFRIAECLYDENIIRIKELKKIINKLVSRFNCHIISFSPNLISMSGKKGNLGPILTFNALSLKNQDQAYFLKINNWNNSLGDLELF